MLDELWRFFRRSVESSVKAEIRCVPCHTGISSDPIVARNYANKGSREMTKRDGERDSPLRTPRWSQNRTWSVHSLLLSWCWLCKRLLSSAEKFHRSRNVQIWCVKLAIRRCQGLGKIQHHCTCVLKVNATLCLYVLESDKRMPDRSVVNEVTLIGMDDAS